MHSGLQTFSERRYLLTNNVKSNSEMRQKFRKPNFAILKTYRGQACFLNITHGTFKKILLNLRNFLPRI